MKNFQSKALGKTFDTIVFGKVAKDNMVATQKNISYDESKIVKTTIAELLKNSKNFANKIVQAEGKVIKISRGIMGSNWIHIEDTNSNKIIFRSLNENVKLGQQTIAIGKASTNVDYGYGYKYDIIILDSVFK